MDICIYIHTLPNYIATIHDIATIYRAWENIGGGKNWRTWRFVNHSSIFFANYFRNPLALEPC